MRLARVLLAEDHRAVAEQLRSLLAEEFDVIGVVADGSALLSATFALQPDAIVSDVSMPALDGMAAAIQILQHDPSARIVFVTVHDDIATASRANSIGALGFIVKTNAGQDLVPAVRAALRGERYMPILDSGSMPTP